MTRLRVSARADKRMDECWRWPATSASRSSAPTRRPWSARRAAACIRGSSPRSRRRGLRRRGTGTDSRVAGTEGASHPPLIVVLDGIEDPHNVGAILRTCDAAGASGVIRQTRHSAALDGVVGKASAGALAHVADRDRRQHRARRRRAERRPGLDDRPGGRCRTESYTDVDWTLPSAMVLGAEGTGLRRLVRDRCDRLVRLPMRGSVDSLNVSVAAGVVLYEAVRQRAGRRHR